MREVDRLFRLQETDNEIALVERKLHEGAQRRVQAELALSEMQQSQREREQALHREEQRLRQVEWSLQELERRVKEMETRLYGGTIRSPKEAGAVQAEIEQLRQQGGELEDEGLSLMLALDELRVQLSEAAAEAAHHEQAHRTLLQEFAAEEAALAEQGGSLQAMREEIAAEISASTLALYEKLRNDLGGQAVAEVVNTTCQGCRLEVPLLARKAARGEALARCEYCGRILYIP